MMVKKLAWSVRSLFVAGVLVSLVACTFEQQREGDGLASAALDKKAGSKKTGDQNVAAEDAGPAPDDDIDGGPAPDDADGGPGDVDGGDVDADVDGGGPDDWDDIDGGPAPVDGGAD